MVDVNMAARIVELVGERDFVTFAELDQRVPGFAARGAEAPMSFTMHENLVLWGGMTEVGARTIAGLLEDGRLALADGTMMTYLADGKVPTMPIAKAARPYQRPRWLPTTLRPAGKANDKAANGWLLYTEGKRRAQKAS